MKSNIKIALLVVAAVGFGVFLGWFAMGGRGNSDGAKSAGNVKVVKTKPGAKVKKITEISLRKDRNGKNTVRIVETEKARPNLIEDIDGADADETDRLTDLQKTIVKELQDALDSNDYKSVKRVLSKFTAKASSGGLGGKVPRSMRRKAVEALGWFGKEAAVDMIPYVFDLDQEVSSEAFSQFEMVLQDCEMSDYDRSEVVKSLLANLTDDDRIESLLNCLTDMRNSVKVATIKDILANGTAQAKAHMMDQMEFYTETDVTSVDALDKWAAMNPDDEGDDEFYGGASTSR